MDIATKRHASIEAVVKVDAGKAGILSWRRE
jgi:hypothetical protein